MQRAVEYTREAVASPLRVLIVAPSLDILGGQAVQAARLLARMRETGTGTGRQLASMMTEFAQRFSAASFDVALGGLEAASEFSARFAHAAGGVLSGIADLIAEKRTPGVSETPAPPNSAGPAGTTS